MVVRKARPTRQQLGSRAFQKHGDELVEALLALTRSGAERVRLGAIPAALDRGWGRPSQAVEGTLDGEITISWEK